MNPTPLAASRASVVNRTHRVVRERARTMQAQRNLNRSLWVPVLIASALVMMLISAFWLVFDEYEIFADSTTDARFHLPILLIWFLPVTGALLITALVRRSRSGSNPVPVHAGSGHAVADAATGQQENR
jgi:cytochrome bd-type quinol oxidase subunit 2